MGTTSIGYALFTKTQQRVLGLLYGNPDNSFYVNEIVRWAAMGRGTVRRELTRMENAGLLRSKREGNQLHYQADAASPIFNELRSIVLKTFGIADILGIALAPLSDRIDVAFVYGPAAEGFLQRDGDIDLMLIGRDLSYASVMDHLGGMAKSHGREVNPSLYSPEELADRLRTDNAFLQRVMEQPKVFVIGSADDINASP
jgi:DNA-binding transcriptional ArsR family regulator